MVTGKLGWRLADGFPQRAAASADPGLFRPGLAGKRPANWRQQDFRASSGALAPEIICRLFGTRPGGYPGRALTRSGRRITRNEMDWGTRLEECPPELRGVNSMVKPNGRLVLVSYAHHCASTPSLSTRWSFWALQGDLILGRASRLYAFSGYHNRTSLPSRALGRTTGTQEVRPSRSSRTKDSPPQISYAHSR